MYHLESKLEWREEDSLVEERNDICNRLGFWVEARAKEKPEAVMARMLDPVEGCLFELEVYGFNLHFN